MKYTSVALALLLSGCASAASQVKTTYDEFSGVTTTQMSGNTLGGCGYQGLLGLTNGSVVSPYRPLRLNVVVGQKDGIELYQLRVVYVADDWLFIESGESLVLLVDGTRMGFTGSGSFQHREVLGNASIREHAYYDVTKSQLRAIANAEEIKVRVRGSPYDADRCFTKINIQNFGRFIAEHIDADAPGPGEPTASIQKRAR